MKIIAYEVRPDERDYLEAEAAKSGVDVTVVNGPLTMENIDGVEGADGVTILGDSRLDANMIEELAKRRVRVVATRTIGYDHIDLNAAKSNGIHVCNGYYDPDGVAEYFASLCKTLYSKLDETMGKSTDYSSMYKAYNDKQLKEEYENYTTKISDAEDELSDYEDRWYDKFSSMETALSKLQSQQNTISGLLGS